MEALGIAVSMGSRRPVVSCVLLKGSRETPAHVDSFDLKTASDDVLAQASDLAQQLSSRLAATPVAAAIIKIADFSPHASRSSGPRNRLLIEGALGYVCKQHANEVEVCDGKEVGRRLKISKSDAEAAGTVLDPVRPAAASAALSGLPVDA